MVNPSNNHRGARSPLSARVILFAAVLSLFFLNPVRGADAVTDTKPLAQFNVRTYGAKGDRTTTDTAAFQKALDACAATGGGEVVVPAGNYLLGSVTLGSNTTLRLAQDAFLTESPDPADYPLIKVRFEGEMIDGHRSLIYAANAHHIAILGPGGFYATSSLAGATSKNPRPPLVIEPVNCDDVRLEDFSLQYDMPAANQRTAIWCIHLAFSSNIVARNLYIASQLSYADGLDIDSSTKVLVDHCEINSGDDCIGLKSGRGLTALRLAKPTEDVTIQNCTLHSQLSSSIALGSELSGGLRNITVKNCALTSPHTGILLKSRSDRGGFVENITLEDLAIGPTQTAFGINLLSQGVASTDPVTGPAGLTVVRNLNFKNIKLTGVGALLSPISSGSADSVSSDQPIDGFTVANFTGDCQKGIILENVVHANFSNVNVTVVTGAVATLTNVMGTGIETLGLPSPQTVP